MLVRDVPIRLLIVAGLLSFGILPMMVTALLGLSSARSVLNQQAFRDLESVRDTTRDQLGRFFDDRVAQMETLAADPYVGAALTALCDAARKGGPGSYRGRGNGAFEAPEPYRAVHRRYAPFFAKVLAAYDYYDLFLMDPRDGLTCFTAMKEADFAMAIDSVDSSLRDAWTSARQRRVAITDTRRYAPSADTPAQFVAAPVLAGERVVGVVAGQISLASINRIMRANPLVGRTGEVYLVGQDYKMRSDSPRDPERRSVGRSLAGTVARNGVRTAATRAALAGRSGSMTTANYDGKLVLAAYAPLTVHGQRWAIVAEIQQSEIDSWIASALNSKLTWTIAVSVLLLLALSLSLSRFIISGVRKLTEQQTVLIDNVLRGTSRARIDPDDVPFDFRHVVHKTNDLISAFEAKTEQSRKLEQIVEYKQRMESIGAFAGGIAHDFNNVLTYMHTYGDMVQRELPADSPSQAHLQVLIDGIDRATELVGQIMTFGRQLKLDRRPVEVGLIVKEAVKLLRASIPQSIKVRCRVEATGLKVVADPTEIHRVVVNLCTNAFHALQTSGGELRVVLTEQQLQGTELDLPAGRYCRLTVTDTGEGVDPAIRERIFDPFVTSKPVGEGTGMGLSVVYGIVVGLGGAIELDSEPGEGTEVRLLLPVHSGGQASAGDRPQQAALPGSERVLLVDDEPDICSATELMLTSLGYRVTSFSDPLQALAHGRETIDQIDLVISDVNMPRLDGLTLVRELRQLRPDLPLVLITGYNQLVTPELVQQIGGAELVIKPYKRIPFSRVLRQALGHVPDAADEGG